MNSDLDLMRCLVVGAALCGFAWAVILWAIWEIWFS